MFYPEKCLYTSLWSSKGVHGTTFWKKWVVRPSEIGSVDNDKHIFLMQGIESQIYFESHRLLPIGEHRGHVMYLENMLPTSMA